MTAVTAATELRAAGRQGKDPGADTAPEPFNQTLFPGFTSAFGLNGSDSFEVGTTPMPATMTADWVRVWQH